MNKRILLIIFVIWIFNYGYSQDQHRSLEQFNKFFKEGQFNNFSDSLLNKYNLLAKKQRDTNHIALSNYYKGLYNFNVFNIKSAIKQTKIANKFFNKQHNNLYYVKSLILLGRIYDASNKNDSATIYYNKALTTAKSNEDKFFANYRLGVFNIKKNRNDKALHYLDRAQEIALKDSSKIKTALVRYRIGNIENNLKHYKKAKQILLESLQSLLNTQVNNTEISNIYFLLGNNNFFTEKYNNAINHYNKALWINKKNKSKRNIGYTYSSLGVAYIYKKEYNKANKYLDSAINYLKITKAKSYLSTAYSRKTTLFFYINKLDSAIKYTEKSLIISKELKDYKKVYILYHNLGFLNDTLGKNKEAYNDMLQAFKYKDSVLKNDYFKKLTEVETKYQTQQKEAEILKLSNENLKKETELIKSKNTIYAIAGVLLLTLGLTFFFWYKRKQKQKLTLLENTVQASEEEKKRIGKELHDGIASSIIRLVHEVEDEDIGLSDKLLKTYNEVRDLSHQLNNTPMYGEALLERLIEIIPESKDNQTFTFKINPSHLKIIEPYGTHIYRIVQELITNNLKHAKATNTKIQILFNEGLLKLTYTDNGIGITKLKKGNGFKNIEDRVTLMKGTISFGLNQEKGFGLELNVPYKIN